MGNVKIIFTKKDPDARFIKCYKAFCSFHDKNCTHYECKYVRRKIEKYFKVKSAKSIPFGKNFLEQERLRRSLSFLNHKEGKLLDIGCSSAEYHRSIKTYKVTGLETSKQLVQCAKKNNPKNKYVQGDITKLNTFNDMSFDVITCFEVLEHLPQKKVDLVLREIYRILKNKGTFLVSVPNKYYPGTFFGFVFGKYSPIGYSKTHFRNYTKKELKRLLQKYKFGIEEVRGYHLFIPFLAKILEKEKAVKIKAELSWKHSFFSQCLIVKARKN